MVLHTVNCPPSHPALGQCLRLLAPGDALLLLGDGVYAALAGSRAAAELAASGAALHVLDVDARAAGVLERLADGVSVCDDEGFVALTERYPRQQAWY
ncbi:sulfurtransferase complex subunit TusB [Parahaliea mediterranea]|uniref:Sulfurtransferase complex subunit TusB n=1 Tax=Parahaliea mediterranea TaxID=651086 RepID=A0A939IMP7_9GAMM|nr:sulfurtransferase complex subunit TusB [Parahaliea mediterranea]MBN7797745.1 sulfurtransferase complex subunit TusB [Parahaliea mediterranea]